MMPAASGSDDGLPTTRELEQLFVQKYGRPETTGWSPRQRFENGYFLPADIYEGVVSKRVIDGCTWLDVGGGHAVFPQNPRLARMLVSRCAKVVAVDPSANVQRNDFVHERVLSTLEEYKPSFQFDLATMRMVVEHVSHPEAFVAALARLVRPAGIVVVLTVNAWSPVTVVSRVLPFRLHHPIKKHFWGGDEGDTFPVHYRMNTRATLRSLFADAGFTEEASAALDDLSVFGRSKLLSWAELMARRGFRACGLGYPENCILGMYRKHT